MFIRLHGLLSLYLTKKVSPIFLNTQVLKYSTSGILKYLSIQRQEKHCLIEQYQYHTIERKKNDSTFWEHLFYTHITFVLLQVFPNPLKHTYRTLAFLNTQCNGKERLILSSRVIIEYITHINRVFQWNGSL